MVTRRKFTGAAALAPFALSRVALAQAWPDRPLRMIIPFPAGGPVDAGGRLIAGALGEVLGQPIAIDIRTGAGGSVGVEAAAKATPDGNTMVFATTGALTVNVTLLPNIGYDTRRDLIPVSIALGTPLLLACRDGLPVQDLAGLIALAKSKPNNLTLATSGVGGPPHLLAEMMRQRAGLDFTVVHYRGAAPAVQDVAGGQLPFMFVDTASGMGFINGGRLRPIGIASAKRVKNFETIPTLDEQGLKGFEAFAWQGLVAPAGTPADVITKLNKTLVEALNSTPVKARFQVLGLEPTPSTPEQMGSYAKAEREKWAEVIRSSGIKLD